MKTTKVYVVPFHATSGESSRSACGGTIAAFKKAVKLQNWPYDNGDDPSFYAAAQFGGQLSWGICRQDVRNNLNPGDIVVFFSFRKLKEAGDSEYRLCAVATMERSISQTDIWQDQGFQVYRRYFNLLIRPCGHVRGSWEHFEPTLEGSRVHYDWLWRLAEHRGFRKDDFKKLEGTDRLNPGITIRRRPVVIAKNYVLFSGDATSTHILSKPPIVAWHYRGKSSEEWYQDKFSQAVRHLTLEVAGEAKGRRGSLRIKNSQRAHRHIVFELASAEAKRWRAEFMNLVRTR